MMKISDLFSMCFQNLFRRKLRTILTGLGVLIGTCSIIMMVSIGLGLEEVSRAQIEEWSDLTIISVHGLMETGEGSNNTQLKDSHLRELQSIEHVQAVNPYAYLWDGQVAIKSGKYQYVGTVVATDLSNLEDMGYKIKEGRYARKSDDKTSIIVGEWASYSFYDVRTNQYLWDLRYSSEDPDNPDQESPVRLFQSRLMLGVNVDSDSGMEDEQSTANTTRETEVKVIGQLEGNYGLDSESEEGIFIDIDYAKELVKEYNRLNGGGSQELSYESMKVKIDNFENLELVSESLKEMGYEFYSAQDELDYVKNQMLIIELVLGALGGISLIVAAIGITNTMIMSIYERTREIGVMKVLGCELKHIRALFLMEAGAIGLLGGGVGIILCGGISALLNLIVSGYLDGSKISHIPPWLALGGIVFSILVGLIAGFLPANRAVRISALSAIRQEN